jgi:hypothetical protein
MAGQNNNGAALVGQMRHQMLTHKAGAAQYTNGLNLHRCAFMVNRNGYRS